MPSSRCFDLGVGLSNDLADDLAAEPITSRILSVGMFITSMRGANFKPSWLMALGELPCPFHRVMCRRPSLAWPSNLHDPSVMPSILMSIWV